MSLSCRPHPVLRRPGPGVLGMLEAVPVALALLDPHTLALQAGNGELSALMACPAEDLAAVWQTVLDGLPAGEVLAVRLLAAGHGEPEPFDAQLHLPGIPQREVMVRARQTMLDGQDLLVVTLQDITRRKRAEAAQAAAESAARRRLAELETLYRTAPLGLAQLDDELRFVRVNEALAMMNGVPAEAHMGCTAWHLVPSLQQETEPLLRRVLATGERVSGVKLSGQTPAAPGMTRDWLAQYYPVHDPETQKVAGVGIVVEEVTGRQRAERAQALLLRELDHRVKNLFAVIAGLVTFSARGAQSPHEMRATLLGRIDALARAHDLVKLAIGGGFAANEGAAHHTTVGALAEALLAPFRATGEPERVMLEGEELGLGALAAPPLALVLHELATNAARYGALAHPGGRLALRWTAAPDRGALQLLWEERNAAPVTTSAIQGFGQRLVTQCALQLGGRATFNWRAEGLQVELEFPLARLEN